MTDPLRIPHTALVSGVDGVDWFMIVISIVYLFFAVLTLSNIVIEWRENR